MNAEGHFKVPYSFSQLLMVVSVLKCSDEFVAHLNVVDRKFPGLRWRDPGALSAEVRMEIYLLIDK